MSHIGPTADTIDGYLAAVPEDRRSTLVALRAVINRNLPAGCEEGTQYGMPAWFVPHGRYPHGYHCDPREPLPFAGIASKKSHIGLHLFFAYIDPELMAWFETEWRKTGCRWDAGKSCVRVKRLEDIPLALVGRLVKKVSVKRFVASYEKSLPASVLAKRERAAAAKKKNATRGKATTKRKSPGKSSKRR